MAWGKGYIFQLTPDVENLSEEVEPELLELAGHLLPAAVSTGRQVTGEQLGYQAAPTSLGHWPRNHNCCTFILQPPLFHKNEKQNKTERLFLKCFP